MMRVTKATAVVVGVVVWFAFPLWAQAQQHEAATLAEGETGQRIVEFVRASEGEGFSGAVLAARDGRVVAAVGVGRADLDGQKPNTPATMFEIASLTKQFTGAAIMHLVQDGRLKLSDSIADHLPGVPDDCRGITVEHLLRHTSGIPGTNSQGGGDDLSRVLPMFLRGGPVHEPGTRWEYWNQGYALLSEIIARVGGEDYVTYCRMNLFDPAGMDATRFTGDEAPEGASVAIGRSTSGPARSALDHPYGTYGFQYRGMGGVVSTVWDLWRWDRALHGDSVLGAEATAKLFEPGLNDYALGWFVRTDRRGRVVHSHGGGVRGFVCEMRRYPDEDAMVVVLSNRDDAPLRRVVQGVEELLFGEELTVPRPLKPLDPAFGEALAGRYQGERGRVLVIEFDELVARAQLHWSPRGPITRAVLGVNEAGDVVLVDGSPKEISFEVRRDEDGRITGASVMGDIYQRDVQEARRPMPPQRQMSRELQEALQVVYRAYEHDSKADPAGAEVLFREALDALRAVPESERDRAHEANVLNGLALALGHNQARLDEAIAVYKECLALRQSVHGPNDWVVGYTESLLGETYLAVGRFETAKEYLLAGYRRMNADPQGNRGRAIEGAERIVKLYEKWHVSQPNRGYDREAEEWRAKLRNQ